MTTKEETMPVEPLRATQAARRLGIPTKEILRLALERKIRFVMVDGLVHFPEDAIAEYEPRAS
jgi:excisionase family DNA binding protein